MENLVKQPDFTFNQAVEITRMLWKGAHEPFIQNFAISLYENGFKWLSDEYIDSEEAEWIVEYLRLGELNQ